MVSVLLNEKKKNIKATHTGLAFQVHARIGFFVLD